MNENEYLEYIKIWKKDNKDLIESDKCRKVFLENLPKSETQINWKRSVGCKVFFIYEDIEDWIEIIDYIGLSKIKILYQVKEFNIEVGTLGSCRLGKIIGKITTEYRVDIGQIFKDNKRDIIISDRETRIKIYKHGWKANRRYYKYICNKCGYDGWIVEGNLLNGQCCPACCLNPKPVLGINTIWDTDKWMIPIVGDEFSKSHTHSCNDKIYPVCPNCKKIKDKLMMVSTIYSLKSCGCTCGDGIKYPNKFAFKILSCLDILFKTEYSPKWCKFEFKNKIQRGYYDFYFKLNNKKYIIEMDGSFHKIDNSMSGQTAEESRFIDNEKDRLAKEHGIEVIRIDCNYKNEQRFEYIKQNIMNSKFNKLFDLSKIDWDKCNRFACNNLVKVACEHKRNNPLISTTEIGKLMGGYSRTTILRWLKQGNGIWCEYNAEQEKIWNSTIRNYKQIICIDTGYVFESIKQCGDKSLKLFDKFLDPKGISKVCTNRFKSYKGYTFKFIKDLTEEEYIKYDIANKLKELNKTA